MRFLCMIALSCAALMAQRTFVIDAQNGPGTNFTDRPQALAQARHGDVYLVRPGVYLPASRAGGEYRSQ